MKVTDLQSKTERTYTLTIAEGPVLDQKYSSTGRRYRLTQVVAVKRDGNWSSVSLSGPVLKKDGSESANRNTDRLYGDHPGWLTELLKGLA